MYNNIVEQIYQKIFVFSLDNVSKIKVRNKIYKGIIISLLYNGMNLFIEKYFKIHNKKETKQKGEMGK